MLESGGEFVPQHAGGELVTPQRYPEFCGRAGPATSGTPPCTHTGRTLPRTHAVPQAGRETASTGGAGAREKVTSADAISEPGPKFSDNAGSGVEFVPQDTDGELVMPPECPELPFHTAFGGEKSVGKGGVLDLDRSGATPPRPQSACGGEGMGQAGIAINSGVKRKKAHRRGPKPKFTEELFERVRRRVARGEGVGLAVQAEGIGRSRFHECVAARPYWAIALRWARENKPPAHVSRRAVGRRVGGGEMKAMFTMDMPEDELRQLSDRMLILLLKAAAPEKYGAAARRVPACGTPPGGKDKSGKRKIVTGSKQSPKVDAGVGGIRSEVEGSSDRLGSRRGFIPQTAAGKTVMSRDCPGFCGKAAPGAQSVPRREGTGGEAIKIKTGQAAETGCAAPIRGQTGPAVVTAPRRPACGTPPGGKVESGKRKIETGSKQSPVISNLYRPAAVKFYAARRWRCGDQRNVSNRGVNSFRKILEVNS